MTWVIDRAERHERTALSQRTGLTKYIHVTWPRTVQTGPTTTSAWRVPSERTGVVDGHGGTYGPDITTFMLGSNWATAYPYCIPHFCQR